MKLNVGCGGRRIPGFTGVDVSPHAAAAEIVAPAHNIPLPTGSVKIIFACHLWEHFYLWECEDVAAEWRRLLCPGGRLTLELPNIIKCCQNLLNGRMVGGKDPNQLSFWGLYGDPRERNPFMSHRWGWSPETLMSYLGQRGFGKFKEEPTQYHPAGKEHRDMRITCVRLEG